MASIAWCRRRGPAWVALALAVALHSAPVRAEAIPLPAPFSAVYDVRTNGLRVGTVTVSLASAEGDEHLLTRESTGGGLFSLVAPKLRIEASRFRLVDGAIQALEYRSRREGGDDDDNAWLVFDWEAGRVINRGAGRHWEVPLTAGEIDPLLMALEIMMDLRRGDHVLRYRVPHQGGIKTYTFAVRGEETVSLDSGNQPSVLIERTDDDRDETSIWSAPALDFLAVKILKRRKWAVDTELRLRSLDLAPPEPAPVTAP